MPLPTPQDGPADPRVAEAVERALNAADGEELQAALAAETARLAAAHDDPDALHAQFRLALDRLQDDLFHRERRLRAETDEGRRRAVRLRMARELLTGDDDATAAARWERESPYRGLWPFREDQAEVFYGRSRLTAELTGHLAACLGETGMAVVTGASGAGKSSLIRAGLIPAIARGQLPVEGAEDWPVLTLTPGAAPVEELAARLAEVTGTDAGSIRNTLAARPGDAYLYARQAVFAHTDGMPPERRDRVRANGRLLLFCDQFEELFTLTRDAGARNAFLQALFAIASGGDGVVVIGVRGDFIDRCASVPALVPVLRAHSFVVGPPEPEELRQVITGPAAAARLHLDDGLADDILADLRAAAGGTFTAGALPLLSQTMLSLWQRRDGDRLTRHGYTEIGGVGRAIEAGAEQIHRRLSPPQQDLAAKLFRELTVIDRHGEASRRRIRRSTLLAEAPGIAPVLEAFTAGRLVVMVGDTVEIAHDVLLRSWKRLETWLQADRMHRALLTEVADDAAEWVRRGRDASFLYRGAKFEAAERTRGAWAADPDTFPELDAVVEEFLGASRRAETHRARVRRAVTASLAVLLVASLTAAGIAFNFNRVAEAANTELTAERNRLLAEDLAEASAANAGVDGDLSRLLAAAAWRIDPDGSYEDTMTRALDDPVDYTAEPHVDEIDRIAFEPDGETLVSGSDGELVLWDVAARTETARADGFDAEALAFSADGAELAVDTGDGVHLLDAADLTEQQTVVQLPADATGFAYAPAGLLVAVDSSLVAIDPASQTQATGPSWNIGEIESLAFSGDLGSYLIGTDSGVWSATGLDAEPEQIWTGSEDRRFSEGGRYMVEWSDTAVTLIDLELGLPIRTMRAAEPITDAAVDAEGATIALAVESAVHYVKTRDMTEVAAFDTGYPDAKDFDLLVDAEGAKLAVTGAEGTKVWKLDGGGLAETPLFDEPDLPGRLVRFHPDGASLMIVDAGSHRRFDLATGAEIDVPWDTEDWIAHVAYSPDGRWITVIDGENHSEGDTVQLDLDSHATILDAETGREHLRIEPVNGETPMFGEDTVAYSPDGRSVAAVDGQTVRIWDLADGTVTDEATGDFSATSALRYAPDGTRLLALGDEAPMVWDLDTGEVRVMDESPSDGLAFFNLAGGATFSLDGRHVVQTSQSERAVEVWDAETGAHLVSLTATGEAYMQRHVPAREAVMALDEDGTLYRQDLGFLLTPYETLCARTDRELTAEEWAEHLPGLDPDSVEVCG